MPEHVAANQDKNPQNGRRTLIVGGAGFVGLAIAEQFLEQGEHVMLLDVIEPPKDAVKILRQTTGMLEWQKCSICDQRDLSNAFDAFEPERIINCAAITPTAVQERNDPRKIFQVNLLAVFNLLELARDRNILLVHVSSSGAFGEIQLRPGFTEPTISEDVLKDPVSYYGISKHAAEQVVLRYAELFGTRILIARVGVVYGPWEYDTGARNIFSAQLQLLRHAMAGREARLERDAVRDFVYSRDVGRAIVALSQAQSLHSKIFHISNGYAWRLSDYAALLGKQCPGFRYAVVGPGNSANVTLSRSKDRVPLDISRIYEEAGFTPAFTLDCAVDDYVNWARSTSLWKLETE